MRLTLRTLLAYLDDTLEPAQTKNIGQKVAESEIAQELIERIKQLTRRHRLTAPPATGPGAKLDPNTIAEYLDNVLAPDKLAEVEEIGLTSDVHLAEIAACHQILTLVLGEPARIPPTARRRMYALSRGHDSGRRDRARAMAAAAAVDSLDSASQDDMDMTLLLGMPFFLRQKAWVRWLVPLAGLLLFAGIGGVVWRQFIWQSPSADARGFAQNEPLPPERRTVIPPAPVEEPGSPTEPRGATPAPSDPKPEGGKPSAVVPSPSQPEPPAVVQPATAPITEPPSPERREVGRYVSLGSVLLQRRSEPEPWQLLSPESPVVTGDTLVSLPGYRSEVRLDSGVRLELWGALPEPNPTAKVILESTVVLHANPAVDLDFTLRYGRVRLLNQKPEGPARVRVRFQEQVWDLVLQDNQADVVLQRWGDDPVSPSGGNDPRGQEPVAVMDLFLFKGQAQINDSLHERILPSPCAYYWHSVHGVAPYPIPMPQPPEWAARPPTLKPPFRIALENLSLELLKKKTSVDAALVAALMKDSEPSSILAVFCLGAIDDVPHLLDALSDGRHREVRGTAAFILKHWLNRSPGQAQKLAAALLAKYQDPKLPELVFWLLHSSAQDRAKPETYQLLIEYLNHEQLPVRELAFEKLTQWAPQVAKEVAKESPYDPANGPEQRERAYKNWKSKIPQGTLPAAPGPSP